MGTFWRIAPCSWRLRYNDKQAPSVTRRQLHSDNTPHLFLQPLPEFRRTGRPQCYPTLHPTGDDHAELEKQRGTSTLDGAIAALDRLQDEQADAYRRLLDDRTQRLAPMQH
jgi:hypothetical protein